MDWGNISQAVQTRIAGLGTRKLLAIGLAAVFVIAAGILATVRLGRPANQTLYSGLSKQEAAKIAVALRDANMPFDASTDSATIYVPYGEAPRARMMLARKGLPNSTTSGYELFDKIGSFGMTSFMQEITKLRAIEGELSRTIQTIEGVQSARVHIVLANPNAFRQQQAPPSASVILQTEGGATADVPVAAIRHLVASALPGVRPQNVTVVTAAGALLASPDDPQETGQARAMLLEGQVTKQIHKNISEALSPYLNPGNYRISVVTRIDADRKESVEQVYLPNSRVERSVQVVRETSDLKNGALEPPTSVKTNLPDQKNQTSANANKTEATQKRSETTNYEISSRTTNTNYSGYQIQALSIAVVLNRTALPETMQDPKNSQALTEHIAEIKRIIEAASGLQSKRGDRLEVALVTFKAQPEALARTAAWTEVLATNSGIIINGLFSVVVVLVGLAGVRTTVKYLRASNDNSSAEEEEVLTIQNPELKPAEQLTYGQSPGDQTAANEPSVQDARRSFREILEAHEDDAILIMKQWMTQDAA